VCLDQPRQRQGDGSAAAPNMEDLSGGTKAHLGVLEIQLAGTFAA
jgi:hypothetical protein